MEYCPCLSSPSRLRLIGRLAAKQYEDQPAQNQYGRDTSQAQHIHNDRPVFPCRRVVVVAIEQHLIDKGADFVFRSFNETEAEIFGRELNAVEIFRNLPLRR